VKPLADRPQNRGTNPFPLSALDRTRPAALPA
jgi:hypothetical protein